jgi:hypothetical protein
MSLGRRAFPAPVGSSGRGGQRRGGYVKAARSLRKIYNISGLIGRESDQPFQGSVPQWTDQLTSIVAEHGMNGFVFWPAG